MPFNVWREQARLNRGIVIAAPVFWAAFSVFLSLPFGIAGFLIHFVLCLPRRKTGRVVCLSAFLFFSGWFSLRYPALTLERAPHHQSRISRGDFKFWTGKTQGFPVPSPLGGTSFLVRTEEGLCRAVIKKGSAPSPGETVLMLAREEVQEAPMNPGQRDLRLAQKGQGISALLQVENWSPLKEPSWAWKFLSRLRRRLERSLRDQVPESERPLITAALLNDTEDISAETQRDFTASGMQHILAISGQHIGLLVAFLLFPALCLRLPRKTAFMLAAIATALYIPLTDSPVSVARAGIMLACYLPSVFLERPASSLNIFFLAVALDLIASPFHLLNLGFQLSYAATLALILCAKPGQQLAARFKPSFMGAAIQMVFLSLVVTLFTYPVLAASTHAFAPWSILGNLVTVPVSSGMLIAGLCVWTFSPITFLSRAAGVCAGFCSLLLEGSVHFLARLPGALQAIAQPTPLWLTFLALMALLIAWLFRSHRFKLGFLAIVAFAALEIFRPDLSAPQFDRARVTVLSVGHGDASVLELPGATLLIDAGPSPGTALRVLIPYLQNRGIRRLDRILLTHPDLDHYGGAFALLDRIPIGSIIVPPLSTEDAGWRCLKSQAKRLGIPWRETRAGDLVYQKGNISLRVLGPDSSLDSASDNNHSLVCLLQTPRQKALFTGDIEGPAQEALAASWPLWRGAWLKAPHHGSDRTTLPCFLSAVSPPQVAISSGHRPGFPGRNTVAELALLHAEAGVTARDGAILWKFEQDTAQQVPFRSMF